MTLVEVQRECFSYKGCTILLDVAIVCPDRRRSSRNHWTRPWWHHQAELERAGHTAERQPGWKLQLWIP